MQVQKCSRAGMGVLNPKERVLVHKSESLLKQTCSTMGTWGTEWSIPPADLLVTSVRGWHALLTQQCSLCQRDAVWPFTGETRLGLISHGQQIDIIATIFFWKTINRRTIEPTICKYKNGENNPQRRGMTVYSHHSWSSDKKTKTDVSKDTSEHYLCYRHN